MRLMKLLYRCVKRKKDYNMKKKIKEGISKLYKILKKPEMAILPSNIAFNLILAIIPIITLVVLIASSFDISIDTVSNLISEFMPKQVSDVIISTISGKGFDNQVGFFNIFAIVIASNGMYALINTSDALYKIDGAKELSKRISSILILFIVILLFLFLLIVPVFGENILELINYAKVFGKYSYIVNSIFGILKWPLTLLMIYLNINLIYTVAPSVNIKSRDTRIGAIFTTFSWTLLTVIFRFYLTYFARYDILYGNLSSIIIMMVWIYFLSYIFTFGMAINVFIRDQAINNEKDENKVDQK